MSEEDTENFTSPASDDEIIVQGNTYIATCLGVLNNNIKLVLCDIIQETHMIDINLLKTMTFD